MINRVPSDSTRQVQQDRADELAIALGPEQLNLNIPALGGVIRDSIENANLGVEDNEPATNSVISRIFGGFFDLIGAGANLFLGIFRRQEVQENLVEEVLPEDVLDTEAELVVADSPLVAATQEAPYEEDPTGPVAEFNVPASDADLSESESDVPTVILSRAETPTSPPIAFENEFQELFFSRISPDKREKLKDFEENGVHHKMLISAEIRYDAVMNSPLRRYSKLSGVERKEVAFDEAVKLINCIVK